MRITDDQGLLNNFATEPEVYFAEPPTASEENQVCDSSGLCLCIFGCCRICCIYRLAS